MKSIEHHDYCQLVYFINEKDVQFVINDNRAYVQAKLESKANVSSHDTGFVETKLQLFRVG